MKVDLGQNVRLVVSLWRYVVSSFRCGVSSFRHTDSLFSEVDSANYSFDSPSCQFDSSAGLVCRFVVSSCRFIVSLWRFLVSTRPLREAIIRRTLYEVLSVFPRFWFSTRREMAMEELRGILQNAISKIEDISSPPNEKDNNQVDQHSTSSISRAEANWRWVDNIQHLSFKSVSQL